ncbi:hypothetical protein B9Z55_022458 [Caenorhabditis nigoni]|uniref:EF-hand domain-containing protein n=1 Tax=Caenorhabditis nigoni TaxID=1611254 RepID=A0A2G5SKQ4_9PELO|nr:hypothetical protein B9Z55_022458 [Caenorhabditis nigoni]
MRSSKVLDTEFYLWRNSPFPSTKEKMIRHTLMICEKTKPVPVPRNSICEEFNEFSRKQLQLFIKIYFTFMDRLSGKFRVRELWFLMKQLGSPLDQYSVNYIFSKINKNDDGNLTLSEFLNMFRLACQDELCNTLSIFKSIAYGTDDSDNNPTHMPSTFTMAAMNSTRGGSAEPMTTSGKRKKPKKVSWLRRVYREAVSIISFKKK